MGFQTLERSALIGIQSRCAGGTSSSAKIASTGHSGTHSVQSMHSSGSITSMLGPSRKQSTGHTSTQSVYLHLMQLSVTTYAIVRTSPPAPNDSGAQHRVARHLTPRSSGLGRFILKKYPLMPNERALFLRAEFR